MIRDALASSFTLEGADPALQANSQAKPASAGWDAGFLFSGQRQDIVPCLLLLYNRLTPLERNAWQILRMLTSQGLANSRYEDLQPFLSNVPCGGRASRETVARVLTMLRLTRWLTLVDRPRRPGDGRFSGSLYVLHEEPLTHRESLELDKEYLELLGNSLSHATKAIRIVAEDAVGDLLKDNSLDLPVLPTRLEKWAERLIHNEGLHDSERGKNHRVRNASGPSSDSEPGFKAPPHHAVRNPNGSTVQGIKKHTARACTQEGAGLVDWASALTLSPTETWTCRAALEKLPQTSRQGVLDEAIARHASGTVRKPAAYLLGLVQKALVGEFVPWAAQPPPESTSVEAAVAAPSLQPPRKARSKGEAVSPLAQSYLAELRVLTGRTLPAGTELDDPDG
ncbi:STY4528 family pathogenicity island replication protein [Pseudomonas sp. LRF_L74]|uniref:STY4528 family pathogenicity island replication protein n=1 Tax=Pseudomonas sp. LRF_L74 TaxID=3369422 RepID=UPI003F64265E